MSEIKTFESKPNTVEAMQYDGENAEDIIVFSRSHARRAGYQVRCDAMPVQPSDWIVKKGEDNYQVWTNAELFQLYVDVTPEPEPEPEPEPAPNPEAGPE